MLLLSKCLYCAGRLRQAIQDYPESNAVLVRRHGVYVWGKDWIQAKTQAECYDYLFEAAMRMRSLGMNASMPPAPGPLQNGHAHASKDNAHPPEQSILHVPDLDFPLHWRVMVTDRAI